MKRLFLSIVIFVSFVFHIQGKHNYGNSNYKTMTNCAPASLIRIVNKTYNH